MKAGGQAGRRAEARARLRFALTLLLLLAAPLQAQIRGVVRDDAGQPVDGALVELLSAGARLASTETDSTGAFAFLSPGTTSAALVVRKIGFLPARLPVTTPALSLVIVLHRRVVVVAGVSVVAPGGRCVDRDRADARAVWQLAVHRYASGAMMPGLLGEGRQAAGNIAAESLGVFDTTRAHAFMVRGGGFRPLPYNRDNFYAQPPLMGMDRSYQWDYPWLESLQAWHFTDGLFGDLNRLAFAPPSIGDLVVEFCSRRGNRPYIVGRLYLGSDTTLLKAEWRFVTDRPREDAGGEVVFMPPAPGAPLLAASGHFWRAKVVGYYQEWSEFLQWYRCPSEAGECRRAGTPLGR